MITSTLRSKQNERRNISRTYEADLVGRLLDRYGVSYICKHPTILFAQPYTTARSLANRISRGYELFVYKSPHGYVGVPDDPEEFIDRVAEAYRILDHIYAPWIKAPASEQKPRSAQLSR